MKYLILSVLLSNVCFEDRLNSVNGKIKLQSKIQEKVMKAWRKHRDAWKYVHSLRHAMPPVADQIRQDYGETLVEQTTEEKKQVMAYVGRVAFFVRQFRKHAKDTRNNSSIPLDRFPMPPLERMHFMLEPHCRRSFFACVKVINAIVDLTFYGNPQVYAEKKTLTKWRKLSGMHQSILLKPFIDMDEYFKFGMTASYFMCWMTLLQLPLLKHLPYCNVKDRWFVGYTKEFYTYTSGIFARNVTMDKKLFAVDYLDQEPFRCALYSFCPDPCCHRIHLIQPNCSQDDRNQCKKQGMTGCRLSLNDNENFNDLIKNRLNVSCKCWKPGERYDPSSLKCVDVDECAEMRYRCVKPNTVCVNTIGSYICACQAGFKEAGGYCTRELKMIEDKLPDVFSRASITTNEKQSNRMEDDSPDLSIRLLRRAHRYQRKILLNFTGA
uniref:EGF-like domain-containing protein n=1 Tax=Trichuris muris TaxID=70415 RepID=A0A5S6QV94_TRIMR